MRVDFSDMPFWEFRLYKSFRKLFQFFQRGNISRSNIASHNRTNMKFHNCCIRNKCGLELYKEILQFLERT